MGLGRTVVGLTFGVSGALHAASLLASCEGFFDISHLRHARGSSSCCQKARESALARRHRGKLAATNAAQPPIRAYWLRFLLRAPDSLS